MFDNTITVSPDGGTTDYVLNKVKANGSGSEYYLNVDANKRIYLTVNHSVSKDETNESHLARLDVHHFNDDGVLMRVSSAWTVIKTASGIQDDADSEESAALLSSFTTTANMSKLVNRET